MTRQPFKSLRISHKLTLISLSFSLPIAVLLYLSITGWPMPSLSGPSESVRNLLIWAMLGATALSGAQYLVRAALLLRTA